MTERATPLADVLVGLVPIALIVGLWQLLASSGVAPPSLLPTDPALVFRWRSEPSPPRSANFHPWQACLAR